MNSSGLAASYTIDVVANVEGGNDEGVAVLGKLEASAHVDGSKFGIDGAGAFVNLQLVHGRSLSEDLVGDAQVTSNIEAVPGLRPLEAWIELPLAQDAVRAKLGLVDLNGEFDVQNVGALFINSSHGIGPDFSQSGRNGPSIFPTTAGAIVLRGQRGEWTGRLGAFDAVAGDPDRPQRIRIGYPGQTGLLAVAEIERRLGQRSTVKLGGWIYSTGFDALAEQETDGRPQRVKGNRGAYATIKGSLARRHSRSLDGWMRIGFANARINPVASTISGGLTWGDDESRFGVAFSRAMLGGPAKQVAIEQGLHPREAETNIEVTYSRSVAANVRIQPDFQYVIDPSWQSDRNDAVIIGVRMVFAYP